MLVYLFRHGIAIDREAPDCPPDFDRYLTDKGKTRTRAAAAGLRVLGAIPQAILSSPYVRARETAEIAAEELGLDAKDVGLTESLVPEAGPQRVLREVLTRDDEAVLCAGHAPNLDLVLAEAVGHELAPFTDLKKAGAACIELDEDRTGRLLWLMPPKVLRALAER
jgi:phosphohistidine phosphatase